jgi:hypothetical protein
MRARWHGKPFHDINLRKWIISLECEEPPVDYDKTKDDLLSVQIKKHREKRSLNSNAYFHLLVDKIAEVQESSRTEIHNWLIAEYGQRDTEINDIIMADEINWKKIDSIHLRPTTATKVLDNGKLYRVYMVMRGSHTYDTKEMARLIDGTVSEAKELGIETMPPDELKRMVELWKVS